MWGNKHKKNKNKKQKQKLEENTRDIILLCGILLYCFSSPLTYFIFKRFWFLYELHSLVEPSRKERCMYMYYVYVFCVLYWQE